MKLFKKLIVTAAVMASVASLAVVSANAAEGDDFTASYSAENNTITITGINKSETVSQLSLLVLSEDATDISGDKAAVYTGVAEDKGIIVQIDQDETFDNKTVKVSLPDGTALPNGTYYVRVGGEAGTSTAYKKAEFTVGSDSPYTDPERLLGDVDASGTINMADSQLIINFVVDSSVNPLIGDAYPAADADDKGTVNVADVQIIINDLQSDGQTLNGKKLKDKVSTMAEL